MFSNNEKELDLRDSLSNNVIMSIVVNHEILDENDDKNEDQSEQISLNEEAKSSLWF